MDTRTDVTASADTRSLALDALRDADADLVCAQRDTDDASRARARARSTYTFADDIYNRAVAAERAAQRAWRDARSALDLA